jgi:hypothetical protein
VVFNEAAMSACPPKVSRPHRNIAAPAAVRIALPKANPGYYLTLSLGITFPFNLAFGIPLLQKIANLFHSWL